MTSGPRRLFLLCFPGSSRGSRSSLFSRDGLGASPVVCAPRDLTRSWLFLFRGDLGAPPAVCAPGDLTRSWSFLFRGDLGAPPAVCAPGDLTRSWLFLFRGDLGAPPAVFCFVLFFREFWGIPVFFVYPGVLGDPGLHAPGGLLRSLPAVPG